MRLAVEQLRQVNEMLGAENQALKAEVRRLRSLIEFTAFAMRRSPAPLSSAEPGEVDRGPDQQAVLVVDRGV